MKMNKLNATQIEVESGFEAESIEDQVRRMVKNNEPITAISPEIFTNESEGVRPEFDIRTDRFDLALDAMKLIEKQELAKNKEVLKADTLATEQGSSIIE